jgi:hypothetical protein
MKKARLASLLAAGMAFSILAPSADARAQTAPEPPAAAEATTATTAPVLRNGLTEEELRKIEMFLEKRKRESGSLKAKDENAQPEAPMQGQELGANQSQQIQDMMNREREEEMRRLEQQHKEELRAMTGQQAGQTDSTPSPGTEGQKTIMESPPLTEETQAAPEPQTEPATTETEDHKPKSLRERKKEALEQKELLKQKEKAVEEGLTAHDGVVLSGTPAKESLKERLAREKAEKAAARE